MKENFSKRLRKIGKVVSATMVCVAVCLTSIVFGEGDEQTKAWEKKVPENIADLLAIQSKLQAALPNAKKAVVALESGGGAGSGVIVSEDGLVLTAAHVSGKPGRNVRIVLPDGRRVNAVTMGGSEISDSGMCKIKEVGKWPFVPMAKKGDSKVGKKGKDGGPAGGGAAAPP